jgi:hypothetical protein
VENQSEQAMIKAFTNIFLTWNRGYPTSKSLSNLINLLLDDNRSKITIIYGSIKIEYKSQILYFWYGEEDTGRMRNLFKFLYLKCDELSDELTLSPFRYNQKVPDRMTSWRLYLAGRKSRD